MHTYLIAELGQNHNGSMDLARAMIDMCAMPIVDEWSGEMLPGIDAIKLCKRDLSRELTAAAADARYAGPQSYGKTYGEHRAALEFTVEQQAQLAAYAKGKGLDVVITVCAPSMVGPIVDECEPTFLKVASRDLTNGPLLKRMAATDTPVIISTGMHGQRDVDMAVQILGPNCVAILHCISEYPARYGNLHLRTIGTLKQQYPAQRVGYSDHSPGIMTPVVAAALGAELIEKHCTVSHHFPGSDHRGALQGEGLWRWCRDTRNLEAALGTAQIVAHPAASPARAKLERSICSGPVGLTAGTVLSSSNTLLLSPGDGVTWPERERLYGKRLRVDVPPLARIDVENVV